MPEGTDARRFESLYGSHRLAIVAYCRRRLPRDVVDDVIAEVFLTAWRRLDHVPAGSELPWLYGVARHVVANQQRSLSRRSRLWDRMAARREDRATEDPDRIGDEERVLRALGTLPEADQEVLRLRAWEELTSAEIGVVLGISAAAVDMRMSRARRRLERGLADAGPATFGTSARLVEEGWS